MSRRAVSPQSCDLVAPVVEVPPLAAVVDALLPKGRDAGRGRAVVRVGPGADVAGTNLLAPGVTIRKTKVFCMLKKGRVIT